MVPLLFFIWHGPYRVYCALKATASLDFRAESVGLERFRRFLRCL